MLSLFRVVSYGLELTDDYLVAVQRALGAAGGDIVELENFSNGRFQATVHAVGYDGDAESGLLALRAAVAPVITTTQSTAVMPAELAGPKRKLLIMDVDSTLIKQEVIELLAEHAGKLDEVAALTDAAMRGELDFAQSLHARVKTLQDLPLEVTEQVRGSVELTDGAAELVEAFLDAGHVVGVVSGGFSQILDPLAEELNLHYWRANQLGTSEATLTGHVEGDVVDRAAKEASLREWAKAEHIELSQTIAIGDGANDLDMLGAAGLGVAFNAKPAVREAADAAIDLPYLDVVRYFAGV
ncbi:phosphoserine phosphatase [Arthrobacter crystallopoietes BAB-32]|uniref:phosphoserine phosphatase n=1 Tax=Arthrobacter crystallopoietes BAB-32 TaxID=1246476 RepID=N1V7G7_9MICC|nr:phosphoserine phosphatase SerB [Arthrobacter crystallopoietes]EMY35944.1 phosphoserine phosphatase [Arthrobacter crystallopoietes BAB-32]